MNEKEIMKNAELLIDYFNSSYDVICFAFSIYGLNECTLNNLTFFYSGYQDFGSFYDSEIENVEN